MAKKPRLSLTKAQVQAGIGAELLALCQSVTQDGSLSREEILALRGWLKANRSSDLPSIGFLAETLGRIIADGKVTKEERTELYKAIETVLPPEARKAAVGNRKAVENEVKAREKETREAKKRQEQEEREVQRQQEREERARNRPLRSANFMVAGVHYEGRPEVIRRHVEDRDPAFLARDPRNAYSRHAIEVRLSNGMQIGFVPEDDAVDMAPLLDEGCPHRAYITKVLTGGRVPIPVVQAYIYGEDADVDGMVRAEEVPTKPLPKSTRSGCMSMVLFVVCILLLAAIW